MTIRLFLLAAVATVALCVDQKSFRAESASTAAFTAEKNGEQTLEIHNVTYQWTAMGVPGGPGEERLLLRTTTHSKNVAGDIPEAGAVTLEAWPLGVDPRQNPLYTIHVSGSGAHTLDTDFWVVDRGSEDVDWWSVYKLGTGQHLFDTYVQVLRFSLTRDVETPRYVGLEMPPDDASDPRLRDPHVVGVVSYAAGDRVIREILLTHTDARRAAELRAYEDTTRTVSLVESPSRRLRITFRDSVDDSRAAPAEAIIPLKGDDLDAAGAQLTSGLHAAPWRR
jgi:hypothetical protein